MPERSKAGRVHFVLLWLFLAAGLGTTAALWAHVTAGERAAAQARLDHEGERTVRIIQVQAQKHATLLAAARALVQGRPSITQADWRNFAEAVDLRGRYRGIDGFAVAEIVPPAEQADFLARQRHDDPGFTIFPERDSFETRWVVALIEPHQAKAVRGFDLASDPVRRNAAELARDTGQPILSDPVTLIANGTDRDFLLLTALYRPGLPLDTVEQRRAAAVGWIVAGYDGRRLVEGVLGPPRPDLALEIRIAGQPLHTDNRPRLAGLRPHGETMTIAGKTWEITTSATRDFEMADRGTPIALAGTVLTLALWWTARQLLLGRNRALALVAERTQALAESEKRYHQLFVGCKAVELLIDPANGQIIDANLAAQDFYGWSIETLRTMRIGDINTLSPDQVKAEMEAAAAENRNHFNFRHRLADGSIREVEVHSGPVHASGRKILYSIVHDITDRRLAEAQVKETVARLEATNQDLEQFAYVASHDLQEPLRMVTSYLQLLEKRYGALFDEDGHRFIGFAVDGAHRMRKLILDLLEFSRVGRRGGPLIPVPLARVMTLALHNLAASVHESRARIDLPTDAPSVIGDEGELARLLQNLIGNALKYRHPDRDPVITVRVATQDAHCTVIVADNGIGIAPEHFDRIFQIFQRLHGREEYEGTGIGLAIARRIVERHGGTIWVDSTPGEGASFHFTLKLAKTPVAAEAAS